MKKHHQLDSAFAAQFRVHLGSGYILRPEGPPPIKQVQPDYGFRIVKPAPYTFRTPRRKAR